MKRCLLVVVLLGLSALAQAPTPKLSSEKSSEFQALVIRQQQVLTSPAYQAAQAELNAVGAEWTKLEAETLRDLKLDPAKWRVVIDAKGKAVVQEKPAEAKAEPQAEPKK